MALGSSALTGVPAFMPRGGVATTEATASGRSGTSIQPSRASPGFTRCSMACPSRTENNPVHACELHDGGLGHEPGPSGRRPSSRARGRSCPASSRPRHCRPPISISNVRVETSTAGATRATVARWGVGKPSTVSHASAPRANASREALRDRRAALHTVGGDEPKHRLALRHDLADGHVTLRHPIAQRLLGGRDDARIGESLNGQGQGRTADACVGQGGLGVEPLAGDFGAGHLALRLDVGKVLLGKQRGVRS
jgi:hypothetical protein